MKLCSTGVKTIYSRSLTARYKEDLKLHEKYFVLDREDSIASSHDS